MIAFNILKKVPILLHLPSPQVAVLAASKEILHVSHLMIS